MRTCGNFRCKNYGRAWDVEHHSMCPYCHITNKDSKKVTRFTKEEIELASWLQKTYSDFETGCVHGEPEYGIQWMLTAREVIKKLSDINAEQTGGEDGNTRL